MSHGVFADGMAIAGKAGENKSLARFPDVCMSPPSPPAGPIPVPYPDTSLSSDLKEGSQTVKLGGQPAALAQQSYYQPSALGDEAATKAWGMNVVTHQITGKTFFQAWSMDVKFEGKNVCRHVDITTSNHASAATTTAPAPTGESQAEKLIKLGLCPCCEKPLHENQKDEKGAPHPLIKEEDYYKKGVTTMEAKLASIPGDIAAGMDYTKNPDSLKKVQDGTAKQLKDAQDAQATVANSRNINPPCENLHNPKDEKCGAHFDSSRSVTSLGKEKSDAGKPLTRKERYNDARERVLGFNDSVKKVCRDLWRSKGKTIGKSSPVNHMTPLEAGGCPTDQKNLVPTDALSPECQAVDKAQTKLQEIGERAW